MTGKNLRFIDYYAACGVLDGSTPALAAPAEKGKLWYLASPYSKRRTGDGGPDDEGLRRAYYEAVAACAALTRQRLSVISPILHSHTVGVAGRFDLLDGAMWHRINAPLVKAAGGMLVLPVTGWLDSEGIQLEIQAFVRNARPIYMLTQQET